MTKQNCNYCKHCWKDLSVDDRDCLVLEKFETDEDIETYYADMKEGCPFFENGNNTEKVGYKF